MNKLAPLLAAVVLRAGFCLAQSPEPPSAANVDKPAPGETPAAATNDTEILASQGATFAAKDRIAVFKGDVRVRDPRFTIACETLTVYLNKNVAADGAEPSPAATPPPVNTAAKPGDADRGSGIDHAVAEGHVIIIQKRAPTKAGEEEKISIGRCDRAEYDSKTGETTLRGTPKVEQNGDFHEALSASTYMILSRDNSLKTVGPSRTYIVQRGKDALPGTKPGGPSPAGSPAGGRRTPASGAQN